jgi:hypothetical protein
MNNANGSGGFGDVFAYFVTKTRYVAGYVAHVRVHRHRQGNTCRRENACGLGTPVT